MKISTFAAVIAVAALAAAGSAQGRPPMGGPGGPGGPGGRMGGGMGMGRGRDPKEMADRQTQMMTQMLGLRPDQQAKVKMIILHSQMEMRRVRDAQTAAMRKILTPDQMKKLDAMRGPGGGMGRGPGGPGMGGPRPR